MDTAALYALETQITEELVRQYATKREADLWRGYRAAGAPYGETLDGAVRWYTEHPDAAPPPPELEIRAGRAYWVPGTKRTL